MASNANTPSTLAELEGTRLEISIMPRGNEKPTITSYYQAVAAIRAIFIALTYSILCWLLQRLFSGMAKGVHVPTLLAYTQL